MAFSEFERRRVQKSLEAYMARWRSPPHIRPELDLAYRIEGQSVEIFEIRPHWRDATKTIETPIAKARYVKSGNCWNIYWMRQDLKWHRYEPNPTVRELEEVFAVVDADQCGCFFG